MTSITANYPSNAPLPHIKPLKAPIKIINLCKEHELHQGYRSQLNETGFDLAINEDFKRMYEQKCLQLIEQISKSKQLEETVCELRQTTRQLQIQIQKLLQGKYDRISYLRHSHSRNRSKSMKKLIPTIDVKMSAGRQKQQNSYSNRTSNNDLFQEIRGYKEEIGLYQEEIGKLKGQVAELRFRLGENQACNVSSFKKEPRYVQREGQIFSFTPINMSNGQGKKNAPVISDFSPEINHEINTIKKDQIYSEKVQFQLKRLKNQLLYKELLLNQLRQQTTKQNGILQKHLKLSVQESRRVAEETNDVMSAFKGEIVDLWKELEFQRQRNGGMEQELRKYVSLEHIQYLRQKIRLESKNSDIVGVLKARRQQKIE